MMSVMITTMTAVMMVVIGRFEFWPELNSQGEGWLDQPTMVAGCAGDHHDDNDGLWGKLRQLSLSGGNTRQQETEEETMNSILLRWGETIQRFFFFLGKSFQGPQTMHFYTAQLPSLDFYFRDSETIWSYDAMRGRQLYLRSNQTSRWDQNKKTRLGTWMCSDMCGLSDNVRDLVCYCWSLV